MYTAEEYWFYAIAAIVGAVFLWNLCLSLLQHQVYMRSTEIPTEFVGILMTRTFDRARRSAIDRNGYNIVSDVLMFLIAVMILFCKVLPALWKMATDFMKTCENESFDIGRTTVFMLLLMVINMVSLIPFHFYYNFVVEQGNGNSGSATYFFCDRLKAIFQHTIIIIPLVDAIIVGAKYGGGYFLFYSWVFVFIWTFFLFIIYPEIIAPLMDKYIPLPDSDLKREIEKLAESLHFPLQQICIVQNSGRSAPNSAYICGLFGKKRIVLFDTLVRDLLADRVMSRMTGRPVDDGTGISPHKLREIKEKKGCDIHEVLAIVCHELGHWKLNHHPKRMFVLMMNILLVFMFFSTLSICSGLYNAFGFNEKPSIVIGFIMVLHFICLPYFGVLTYAIATVTRKYEFEADLYSKSLGHSLSLKCALLKLAIADFKFPFFDPWYSSWLNWYPQLLERLEALDRDE